MDDKGPPGKFVAGFLRNAPVWIVVASLVFLGYTLVRYSGVLP